jgi:hypothetical protein
LATAARIAFVGGFRLGGQILVVTHETCQLTAAGRKARCEPADGGNRRRLRCALRHAEGVILRAAGGHQAVALRHNKDRKG